TVGSAFALDLAEGLLDYGTPTGLVLNGLEELGIPGASVAKDLYKGIASDIGDFFLVAQYRGRSRPSLTICRGAWKSEISKVLCVRQGLSDLCAAPLFAGT